LLIEANKHISLLLDYILSFNNWKKDETIIELLIVVMLCFFSLAVLFLKRYLKINVF